MRRACVLLALTGCSSIFGLHDPAHGTVSDASSADSVDATDGARLDGLTCVGHGALAVCFDAPPTSMVQLPPTIDTSAADTCKPGAHWVSTMQPDACFIFGQRVTQTGTTLVIGPRPLVVIATDRLEIDGLLDASSHVGGTAGPDAGCEQQRRRRWCRRIVRVEWRYWWRRQRRVDRRWSTGRGHRAVADLARRL